MDWSLLAQLFISLATLSKDLPTPFLHESRKSAVPEPWRKLTATDRLYRRRMMARDGWGRARRPVTRLGFYIRSHAIRMPLPMLVRHLWIKWRKGRAAPASG